MALTYQEAEKTVLPYELLGNELFIVVGLGSAGSRHLKILSTLGVRRLGLVRSYRGPASRATPIGTIEFPSLESALREEPRGVIIATPTSLHYEQVRLSLGARIPVLVEKPLCETHEEATDLVELAKRNNVYLQVGYHLRQNPIVKWLRALVHSKQLGAPRFLRATWGEYLPDWHPNEDYRRSYAAVQTLGGGPLLTLGHVIDYAIQIMGPTSQSKKFSYSVSDLELDVSDTTLLILEHTNGGISQLEMDYWTRPPRHRLEVRFEMGIFEWDLLSGQTSLATDRRFSGPSIDVPQTVSREACFELQMREFLSNLVSKPTSTIEHELIVARVLDSTK